MMSNTVKAIAWGVGKRRLTHLSSQSLKGEEVGGKEFSVTDVLEDVFLYILPKGARCC
jgi:hypothetical protein